MSYFQKWWILAVSEWNRGSVPSLPNDSSVQNLAKEKEKEICME
jgi:hypothetical protein